MVLTRFLLFSSVSLYNYVNITLLIKIYPTCFSIIDDLFFWIGYKHGGSQMMTFKIPSQKQFLKIMYLERCYSVWMTWVYRMLFWSKLFYIQHEKTLLTPCCDSNGARISCKGLGSNSGKWAAMHFKASIREKAVSTNDFFKTLRNILCFGINYLYEEIQLWPAGLGSA